MFNGPPRMATISLHLTTYSPWTVVFFGIKHNQDHAVTPISAIRNTPLPSKPNGG